MDRYEIGFEIGKTLKTSSNPLGDINYIAKILGQYWQQYIQNNQKKLEALQTLMSNGRKNAERKNDRTAAVDETLIISRK